MIPKYIFQDIEKEEETQIHDNKANLLRIRVPQAYVEGVKLTPGTEHVLLPSFACLILGKPSSGKSHIIAEFLDQPAFYNKKFDRIVYVGPSKYKGVVHDEYNTVSSFDMKFIDISIAECTDWASNMLSVMDDVISQMPTTQKSRAQELFFNRRHELKNGTISIIVTSQKLTSVPTWIRSSINCIIAFSIPKCEIKVLFNEIPLISNVLEIKNTFESLTRHQFIFFNLERGKAFDSNF